MNNFLTVLLVLSSFVVLIPAMIVRRQSDHIVPSQMGRRQSDDIVPAPMGNPPPPPPLNPLVHFVLPQPPPMPWMPPPPPMPAFIKKIATFYYMDTNKDQSVDWEEAKSFARLTFTLMDLNNNGELDESEFHGPPGGDKPAEYPVSLNDLFDQALELFKGWGGDENKPVSMADLLAEAYGSEETVPPETAPVDNPEA